MKNTLILLFCFFTISSANSQVSAVKYMIEKDEETGHFNCNLIVTEGNATEYSHLSDVNLLFSIIIPAGTEYSTFVAFNPKQDDNGTASLCTCWWPIANDKAPIENPDYDYLALEISCQTDCYFNHLNIGDTIKLISIDFETECPGDIRPFDINTDINPISTGFDYNQSFTLNNSIELYEGNYLPTNSGNEIRGKAYVDKNENGIYDEGEIPLRNVAISVSPTNSIVLTDYFGNYSITVPEGTYSLLATINEGDWIEHVISLEDIEVSPTCNSRQNIGFISSIDDIEMATISVVNSIARCDFETRFTITIENTGVEVLEGQLEFTFDDKTSFLSSDIPGAQTIGNIITANVGPLAPFSPKSYLVTLKMPSGSSNLPQLAFDTRFYSQSSDLLAEYSYSDQLRCSYDPNDKREYPNRVGENNLTLMSEDLEYTIRFQNNGNDTAFQVKVVDVIDPSIEPSSVRVISSSHDLETSVNGTEVVFLFEDILLVDSTTNYSASQGYVTFKCNAKEGIAEYTPVNNQADIIFDTNPPIVTNQTINTLVTVLCIDIDTLIEKSICAGESYAGYFESGTYTDMFTLPFGCDSLVTIFLDVQEVIVDLDTVDICEGETILFNGINYDLDESTAIVDTIVNPSGCISEILSLQVNITPLITSNEDIMVCEGEQVTINGNSYILNASTEIVDSTINENGCLTAIHTCQVIVIPAMYEQLDTTICEGYDVQGLTVTGTYSIDSFDITTGCQLEYTINLNVLPASDPECTVATNDLHENLVELYPNPSSGSIFIKTVDDWESITIFDKQGRTVTTVEQNSAASQEVIVSHYLPGVYMIVFWNAERILTNRFVVN